MPGFSPTRRWVTRAALGAGLAGTSWLQAAVTQGAVGQALPGGGKRLRIGMAAPNTTLDPHFQSNAPNNAVASHIFDALVTNDPASRSLPGLAESWTAESDTRWVLKLRQGVTFTDGSPFTAEDAIVSLRRANDLPSTASFRTYTRSIKTMTAPDPHTLVIETDGPDPLLPNSLSRIRIIRASGKDATTPQFNDGSAAIGTGPFVLKQYTPGNRILLGRNPSWWGGPLPWDEVLLVPATDDGGRLASLLSGDFDIIEAVPSQSTGRVKENPRFQLIRGVSSRVVYLAMDQHRDTTPFITDRAGKPLAKNPLKDIRVRQALSLAISRQAIAERVMEGDAVPASQLLPKGAAGTSDALNVPAYDPNRAKALLAEAGYAEGFRMTVHGPNDRYINDAKIVQAVAQMFTRIGIETTADVMPWSVYAARSARSEFSFSLGAWGVNTGETSNPLKALLATRDAKAGMGASNNGQYSNAELDKRLVEALRTMDDAARNKLLAEASEIAFRDFAILPLHHEVSVWAGRQGITYATRADQYTLAVGVGG
ncbi:ABC transporter substrate-binding protein [Roseomonas sp. 18066]|uniref:ABC transporter substrate-binding protein n=1 Tax=Roseomonas sp. 18066 TaxID=2681412 RepID=UPI001356C01A|nr:ABC transporter substrate-binding protein [Roseomonas sp. 18066]